MLRPSVLPALLLSLSLWACGAPEAADEAATLLPAGTELRPGDVVLRRGSGLTSRVVLMADREGQYSHAGIVADSAGTLYVVHAVPGEPDFKGDVDRVKRERPEAFFAPQRTDRGAVLRPADSLAAKRAARAAWQAYERRVRFDHSYDDADTTRLYCTELVLHAYRRAGLPLLTAPPHRQGFSIGCYLPLDLERSPLLRCVARF